MNPISTSLRRRPASIRSRTGCATSRTSAPRRSSSQVAAKVGWEPRTGARKRRDANGNLTGQGFAYAVYVHSKFPGLASAWSAWAADVAVNPATGEVSLTRVTVGQDSGLMINPEGVRHQIHGNVIQSTSRVLKEEVTFSDIAVTSRDWGTYPLLTFPELPAIDLRDGAAPRRRAARGWRVGLRAERRRDRQRDLRRDGRAVPRAALHAGPHSRGPARGGAGRRAACGTRARPAFRARAQGAGLAASARRRRARRGRRARRREPADPRGDRADRAPRSFGLFG